MQLKSKLERDPPPTKTTFLRHAEKASFDNDLEKDGSDPDTKVEHVQHSQQRASPEAERAVVRKLDWRVRLHCFIVDSQHPAHRKFMIATSKISLFMFCSPRTHGSPTRERD